MKILLVSSVLALVTAFALVRPHGTKSMASHGIATAESQRIEAFDRLVAMAESSGSVRVIVGLGAPFAPEGSLSRSEIGKQRSRIKTIQSEFLSRIQASRPASIKQFEYIPYVALEADASELERLQADSSVIAIEEDIIGEPALAESVPIVGAPAAWSSGFTGSGQTVAILDSGVDKNHSFLASKVISEACYSTNSVNSTSFCPGGAASSTEPDSGLHCPTNVSGCAHGTNVAGIAAGRGNTFSGVAKDANIIAIKIFSQVTSSACTPDATCARYFTSDLILGLERVKALSETMKNIAAVDLSLQTGQQFASNCDVAHAATKAAIDNLRSVGIPTIVCAGNYSFTNALTAPSCISTSISVGSVDDGSLGTALNSVSDFSDSSPLLNLLAPGRWINSSIPNNAFQNYSGTSMAAPHVAGAFAILRQKSPNASVGKILKALSTTGTPITDLRNGLAKPRINIGAALNVVDRTTADDFDDDGKADLAVRRPTDNIWYFLRTNAGYTAFQYGEAGDVMAPADYDGDGKSDVAVFRPSSGTWFVKGSSAGFYTDGWGQSGDLPVPADYDEDGKADEAVYRPSSGTWYLKRSSLGILISQFGTPEDKPQIGDFDGDGKADLAVMRPSNNTWYFLRTTAGFTAISWGTTGDVAAPADYDGDGKIDVAVFRPSTGVWFVAGSSAGFSTQNWGASGDIPVPADYDGDGKADVAVYRPSNATWYFLRSSAGILTTQFGTAEDKPVQNVFNN